MAFGKKRKKTVVLLNFNLKNDILEVLSFRFGWVQKTLEVEIVVSSSLLVRGHFGTARESMMFNFLSGVLFKDGKVF